MKYSEEVVDHARHPRNFGNLKGKTHQAKEINASCGDIVEVYLKIENGVVKKAGFGGVGCALSTAMASMLTEKVEGMEVVEVREMGSEVINELMGEVNPGRQKCVRLPLMALGRAVGGVI